LNQQKDPTSKRHYLVSKDQRRHFNNINEQK
jgi:hypothetical protein